MADFVPGRSVNPRASDLVGQKFNHLTVVRRLPNSANHQSQWLCLCVCGQERTTTGAMLKRGDVKSCGCLRYKRGAASHSWQGYGPLSKTQWSRIVSGARERDLLLTISPEFVVRLFKEQNERCALSGWPITLGSKKEQVTASLDRIDSNQGYLPHNVQWLHKDVNKLKVNLTDERFVEICQAVAAHTLATNSVATSS